MKLLVTGGCGFIGSNFIRLVLRERPEWRVVNFDLLAYSGNLENLAGVDALPNYSFVRGDVAERAQARAAMAGCDAVVHFAAESHVDRSIQDASPFVRTNVAGTQTLLDCALELGIGRYVQVSTDEVYGALTPDDPPFTEATPLAPRNPYSATKAGADCLALAYYETHRLPVMVTRCPNNYGPYQFPEKLIPLMIIQALHGQPLPVYGDGRQVRDWIHAEDHNRAILAVLERGRAGQIYHAGAHNERFNINVVQAILAALGKPESLIRHVEDRKGHDRRYAMSAAKLRDELGWSPQISFERGLADTIGWYVNHHEWWSRVQSGAYREYYERQYASRLDKTGA